MPHSDLAGLRDEVQEVQCLRSQFLILKRGLNIKHLPSAFTEQGVTILSSVLRSARSAQVNVEIMRAFVGLHRMVASNAELARRLHELEKYDGQFKAVFDAIRALMTPPRLRRRPIGFRVEERGPGYRRGRLRRALSR